MIQHIIKQAETLTPEKIVLVVSPDMPKMDDVITKNVAYLSPMKLKRWASTVAINWHRPNG